MLRSFITGWFLVAALAAAGCGSEPEAAPPPAAPAAVAPGAEAEVAGASVRVADTITASRIVLDGGSAYEPDGTYVLVRLALEPAGSDPARISDREVVLLGAGGETYKVDKPGTLAIATGNTQTSQYDPTKPNGLYGPIDVAPGSTADLIAVFDVPDGTFPDARLQLGPRGSTRLFELDADGSVDTALSDLGVRLVQ